MASVSGEFLVLRTKIIRVSREDFTITNWRYILKEIGKGILFRKREE
ncbi:unnamed protein product [Linum tenue]|uniref:Uncharacterized protein n=1 Tax=Linum tenue TaxID=586396 RepID=A0AAV0IY10_9ROSI|nr:unnamed protein product [Linum tenue]